MEVPRDIRNRKLNISSIVNIIYLILEENKYFYFSLANIVHQCYRKLIVYVQKKKQSSQEENVKCKRC